MGKYLFRRFLHAIAVLLGVTFLVFALLNAMGDPVALMLPPEATHQQIAEFRSKLGMDAPLHIRYLRFLTNAVHGDLGVSLRHSQPAMNLVLERFPATVELASAAMLIALAVGVPAGVISARYRNSIVDVALRIFALLGQSMPVFWLGILLMILFGVILRWLPINGRHGFSSIILPAVTLGMYSAASITRMLRSSMLEVLQRDYVRTARAKGVRESRITYKHALGNASLPTVTMIGLQFGILLGGAVVTETVFAWPGIGDLAVQAISNRDLPVVQAVVVVMATTFVLLNMAVDLLYARLDPRIRY